MKHSTIYLGGAGVTKGIPRRKRSKVIETVFVVSAPDRHANRQAFLSFVQCKPPSCPDSHALLRSLHNAPMTAGLQIVNGVQTMEFITQGLGLGQGCMMSIAGNGTQDTKLFYIGMATRTYGSLQALLRRQRLCSWFRSMFLTAASK